MLPPASSLPSGLSARERISSFGPARLAVTPLEATSNNRTVPNLVGDPSPTAMLRPSSMNATDRTVLLNTPAPNRPKSVPDSRFQSSTSRWPPAASVFPSGLNASPVMGIAGPWVQLQYGIALTLAVPSPTQWLLLSGVLAAGVLAGLVPGVRAYRLSLADGLAPRS